MIEEILNKNIVNLIYENVLLSEYENCLLTKKCYGFKLSKKEERDYWYILNFKYPMIKMVRRIIENGK